MEIQKKVSLPLRIKGRHYDSFRDCPISTNYYQIRITNQINEIHIYKVVYNPYIPSDNTKLRYSLLTKGMNQIKTFIPSPVISGTNIYSLKSPSENQREIRIDQYSVKIKHIKTIPVKENPKTLLMFLNNALRNVFRKINYTQIGKTGKFFQVSNPETLDNDLKMFSGFKANFMSLQKGIFLRVDTAKKIVRNETVLDYINKIYSRNNNKERDQKRSILKNELIGQIVMTNYGKTRYVKIIDLVFDTVDEYKLNGSDTTLRQFYETKYNKKIVFAKQPLIQIQSKTQNEGNRTILVPQLCLMTGIPDNFDEFKRKKISQATIRSPEQKKTDIQKFMKQAQSVNDLNSLKQLGIQINKNLYQVKARIIPCPRLQLGSNRSVDNGREANFQLFRDPIFESKHSVKCGIFTTQNADVRGLLDTFKNTARNLNVKFECTVYTTKQHDKHRIFSSYFAEIDNAIRKEGINICLVVIPQFLKQNYGQIKKQCLKKLNIVSQCVVDGTLRKKNLQSVATKILLQMIAKRGNILWVPKTTGKISDAMIMAFDNAGSCLSCCATVNETFSSYFSQSSSFTSSESKFAEMVKLSFEAINFYAKKNTRPPKQVLIFHNSCTGDQMALFRNFFIETLLSKLADAFGNSNAPKISLIMVNVKTNQRFFISDKGGARNVNAGTIVANDIVSENYDFYLVSQGSNRGSTVPNHYKVAFSNSMIEEGLLHELIFSQCFNYVNWTGSIKIPGILQYAKKCAKFSAEAMSGQQVKEELQTKLYYV